VSHERVPTTEPSEHTDSSFCQPLYIGAGVTLINLKLSLIMSQAIIFACFVDELA
jgi:hypothetical protein